MLESRHKPRTALRSSVYAELAAYIAQLSEEPNFVAQERRAELSRLATFVSQRKDEARAARLLFICTHNSRRSHLAQIWAQTAAHLNGITNVETYSGGTEATTFDPRAVAALERAGFSIEIRSAGDNPVYAVRYSDEAPPIECFSKRYDQPPNPTDGFCSVMTCSAADEACPVVLGASERISLPYDDPKDADGTPLERRTYDERCREIAREMFTAFSHPVGVEPR